MCFWPERPKQTFPSLSSPLPRLRAQPSAPHSPQLGPVFFFLPPSPRSSVLGSDSPQAAFPSLPIADSPGPHGSDRPVSYLGPVRVGRCPGKSAAPNPDFSGIRSPWVLFKHRGANCDFLFHLSHRGSFSNPCLARFRSRRTYPQAAAVIDINRSFSAACVSSPRSAWRFRSRWASPFFLWCDLRRANRCRTHQERFQPPFEELHRPRGFFVPVFVLGESAWSPASSLCPWVVVWRTKSPKPLAPANCWPWRRRRARHRCPCSPPNVFHRWIKI